MSSMPLNKYLVLGRSLVIAVLLSISFGFTQGANGQECKTATISRTTNVYEKPPRVTFKTLYTFQLTLGKQTDVLEAGSRVQTLDRTIAGTQEWFRVTYQTRGEVRDGWVYVGDVGTR